MEEKERDRLKIQTHVDAIRYHLKQIEEDCGFWYTETESYAKLGGTAHRHMIRFDDVWGYHVATIGEG